MSERVRTKCGEWRRKLIDLTRRNRLLHFRPTPVTTLRIVDESPNEIYRLLLVGGATLHFRPKREGETPPADSDDLRREQTDRFLQTELEKDRLAHSLLQIHRKMLSIQEEQGIHTLFLTLGIVEWFEASSEEAMRSPLLLLPVELSRTSVRSEFRLRMFPDDPVVNPALAQRWKNDFGIDLPVLPDDPAVMDPAQYFGSCGKVVRNVDRARLDPEIHLGLLSFTKFLMYKELEAAGDLFTVHPVIRALSGEKMGEVPDARGGLSSAPDLDSLSPEEAQTVLEADSSQEEAILAVRRGRNLVIEGPPGTGKSQTIANLIAATLGEGKSVLFVSEKMAALRVVHDRLRQAGLADFCLELHSRHTNKGQVVAELGRVLDLSREPVAGETGLVDAWRKAREDLRRYVVELHEPVGPLGLPIRTAIGELANAQSTTEVPVFLPGAGGWSRERFEKAVVTIRELAATTASVSPEERHPWRDCLIRDGSYETQVALRKMSQGFLVRLRELEQAAGRLSTELELPAPATLEEIGELDELARLLAESPKPPEPMLADERWDRPGPDVEEALLAGKAFSRARAELAARYSAEIFDGGVEEILEWWKRHGGGLFRLFRPAYWRHRRRLLVWCRPGAGLGEDPLRDLESAAQATRARALLRGYDGGRFGPYWKAEESDWEGLARLAAWLIRYRSHVRGGRTSERVKIFAREGHPGNGLSGVLAAFESCRTDWVGKTGFAGSVSKLQDLHARVEEMLQGMERLPEWVHHLTAREAARGADTNAFLTEARSLPPAEWERAFGRQFLRSWLEEVLPQRPAVGGFDRERHERTVREFRDLDRRLLHDRRRSLRNSLLSRLPDPSGMREEGEGQELLLREVRKKRAHLALRKLFAAASPVVRRVKPCFLMSPLSVSQFLEPTGEPFDLLIFDEASQITPEDSVGAIARARQVVVVGDSRQLPPTPFFQRELGEEEAESWQEGLESILDECAVAFPDRRMLRWHYRSRHESLIAFSNAEFYGGRLFTFPSPDDGEGRLGVSFVLVAGGVYDRGGSGTNREEARGVAASVFEQLKRDPGKSVGVGAFSVRQQAAIQDELEKLRREDPSLEANFDSSRDGYCFVKNLETIQGDERDVIFLSIGYGRNEAGKFSMNFGPLNNEGGARRLNVLVTRARERVEVFSSILPEEIDLSKTDAEGVRKLRAYLEYAKGAAASSKVGEDEVAGPFALERHLRERLEAAGWTLSERVGRSGYRIDLGVHRNGRYLLGIETDGESYRSGATVRDRDRLRPEVLERLGWKLHRVWSPEWLRTPDAAIDRVRAELR